MLVYVVVVKKNALKRHSVGDLKALLYEIVVQKGKHRSRAFISLSPHLIFLQQRTEEEW